MSTPVPFSMFVIGLIVFILYLTGYVYMIIKASNQQKEEFARRKAFYENIDWTTLEMLFVRAGYQPYTGHSKLA